MEVWTLTVIYPYDSYGDIFGVFSSFELCEIEAKKFESRGCCYVIEHFTLDKLGCLA